MKRLIILAVILVLSLILVFAFSTPSFADIDEDFVYDKDPCLAVGPEDFEREVNPEHADHNWWEACDWWDEYLRSQDDAENEGYYESEPEEEIEEEEPVVEDTRDIVVETEEGHEVEVASSTVAPDELPETGLPLLLALFGISSIGAGGVILKRTG